MSDPSIEPGESVWRTVSAGTNHKLHTRPHCPALQQSSQVMETTLQCHPDPDWCRICTGDGPAAGGGSREIYQLAKSIGEDRAEAADD